MLILEIFGALVAFTVFMAIVRGIGGAIDRSNVETGDIFCSIAAGIVWIVVAALPAFNFGQTTASVFVLGSMIVAGWIGVKKTRAASDAAIAFLATTTNRCSVTAVQVKAEETGNWRVAKAAAARHDELKKASAELAQRWPPRARPATGAPQSLDQTPTPDKKKIQISKKTETRIAATILALVGLFVAAGVWANGGH